MKNEFPEYYPLSEAELKTLWSNGLVSFDANVMLNFYRYSSLTREKLIATMKALGPRLWIPHQAALEFNRNRAGVIAHQAQKYADAAARLSSLVAELEDDSSSPFVSTAAHEALQSASRLVLQELQGGEKATWAHLTKDTIHETLADLLVSRVGEPLPQDVAKKVLSEGPDRYSARIPPGYNDAKKEPAERRFGDLLLWNQLLRHANGQKTPIIFITNDRKDDWWWIESGKAIGPRPELRAEMFRASAHHFHMYTMENFLRHSPDYGLGVPDQAVIDEVKKVERQIPTVTWPRPGDAVIHPEHHLGLTIESTAIGDQRRALVQFAGGMLEVPATQLLPVISTALQPEKRPSTAHLVILSSPLKCPSCNHESRRYREYGDFLCCTKCQQFFIKDAVLRRPVGK